MGPALVRPVHPQNAPAPIPVTLAGMVILVRLLHPENAEAPMPVTSVPLIWSGITTSVTPSFSAKPAMYPSSGLK